MISRHKISSSPTSVFLGKPENIGVLWNLVPTGIAIAPIESTTRDGEQINLGGRK
jgi:hypothetical protein